MWFPPCRGAGLASFFAGAASSSEFFAGVLSAGLSFFDFGIGSLKGEETAGLVRDPWKKVSAKVSGWDRSAQGGKRYIFFAEPKGGILSRKTLALKECQRFPQRHCPAFVPEDCQKVAEEPAPVSGG
jgi:hypothetical protein